MKNFLFVSLLTVSLASFAAEEAGPTPRMANGRPDLSGVWWTGGDLGSAGYGSTTDRSRGLQYELYTNLYNEESKARMAMLNDKDDPTLFCKPTAFGTLMVRFFDAGAVGQIMSTPDMMVFLQETFHGYQLVPTDGRDHRDYLPPSYRGDAVGHWEGDTFVVETKNFRDDTWMFAEGGVSFHSDQLRIVERYERPDANTLVINATVYDPVVLTQPWEVPTKRLVLAPFDQLLPLVCESLETAEIMKNAQGGE